MARRCRVPLAAVFVAEWARVLHDGPGLPPGPTPDVLFGLAVSGRSGSGADLARISAQLLNVVPFRTPRPADGAVGWDATAAHLLQVRRHEWAAMPEVRSWSGLPPEHLPFDTYLVIQNLPALTAPAADLFLAPRVGSEPIETPQMEYPLRITVSPYAHGLHVVAVYLPDRLVGPTARALLEAYVAALAGVAARAGDVRVP